MTKTKERVLGICVVYYTSDLCNWTPTFDIKIPMSILQNSHYFTEGKMKGVILDSKEHDFENTDSFTVRKPAS